MYLWISLIVDILICAVMWCHDMPGMLIICVLCGLVTSELVAKWSFHLFFRDSHEYGEAWKFSWKPDIFSLIDGELDDWWASWKLSAYHLLVVISGIGVFCFLNKWLGSGIGIFSLLYKLLGD